MNIKNFTLSVLSLFFIMSSCKKDDDTIEPIALRDEGEVYEENIEEIEDFLKTHTFNYEEFDFDNPYNESNDAFKLKIDSIPEGNPDGDIPLFDMMNGTGMLGALTFKTVEQNGIDYKLYVLKIREGLGDKLHPLDRAAVLYEGSKTNAEIFDSAVTPARFNLTTIGSSGGVVTGFREGLIEFKTATSITTAPDGVDNYKEQGIGAVFIPSGLAYFASAPSGIGPYNPIIFTLSLVNRLDTDYDNDGIPSHLEDIEDLDPEVDSNGDGILTNDYEGDGNGFNDNTDGDNLPNFVDNDDDGDGVLTINEDLDGNGDPTDDDTDGDGIPNYLDADSTGSN